MQAPTETPSAAFESDTQRDINRMVAVGCTPTIAAELAQHNAKVTRLERELKQAWANLVEEESISVALEVVANEVTELAKESGCFNKQERFILAGELFAISERAERTGL